MGCVEKYYEDGVLKERDCYTSGTVHAACVTGGPGTELKKLLASVGITSSPGCKCNRRAKTMDEMGCQWCSENVETIVDWLQEEAYKRHLPFVRLAAKMLVQRAIRNADTRK